MTSKAARFQIIEDLRAHHGLVRLLKLAAVSRSGYYKWRKSIAAAKERRHKEHELESHLLAIHRVHPYFGYLRMSVALRREGLRVNQKRVYRLMKQLGICSVIRKKRRFFGKQVSVVNPNRLERQFRADTPRTKLVLPTLPIFVLENNLCISLLFRIYTITKL